MGQVVAGMCLPGEQSLLRAGTEPRQAVGCIISKSNRPVCLLVGASATKLPQGRPQQPGITKYTAACCPALHPILPQH